VHIERQPGGSPQAGNHRRANSDIRDKVAIHYVNVHKACASFGNGLDVVGKVRKIR
jgi:hypothetical protein